MTKVNWFIKNVHKRIYKKSGDMYGIRVRNKEHARALYMTGIEYTKSHDNIN